MPNRDQAILMVVNKLWLIPGSGKLIERGWKREKYKLLFQLI